MADPNARSLWYDHSSSGNWGWVITVPNQEGFYITSFLSTIVTIAGASAWNIVSLLIHAYLARQGSETDIFGLQQQVSLRNSPSGFRAAYDALTLLFAWGHAPRSNRLWRTAAITVPGLLVWSGFFIASLLTSKVANEATDRAIVRMQTQDCGFLLDKRDDTPGSAGARFNRAGFSDLLSDKWVNDTINARAYALSMQSGEASSTPLRSTYMNPKLNYTLEKAGIRCGVQNETFCMNQVNATIRLTSQRIDSHADLGINAPLSDRVAFQHKAECSVINDKLFTYNSTKGDIEYRLGPIGNKSHEGWTYLYPRGDWNAKLGYHIKASYAPAIPDDDALLWRPIEGIARTDADQGIIFLSQNGVRYSHPVLDPFFIAKREDNGKFKPNSYTSTMICAEQWRWCKPSLPGDGKNATNEDCTRWDSHQALQRYAVDKQGVLGFNAAQSATAARLSFHTNQIIDSPVNINTAALFASSRTRFNTNSVGLPQDQWHKEIEGWFATALARYQASANDYVRKSTSLKPFEVLSPFDPEDIETLVSSEYNMTHDMISTLQAQCAEQLTDDAVHMQNFSLVGVLIILIVSFLLVGTSFCFVEILNLVSSLRRRRGRGGASRSMVARQADDKMHLLRYTVDAATRTHHSSGEECGGHGGKVTSHGNDWKLARVTGIPLLVTAVKQKKESAGQDFQVPRPTIMDNGELAVYPEGTQCEVGEDESQGRHSESSPMLSSH